MIEKNGRMCRMVFEPGTPWDDVESVLDDFRAGFLKIRKEAEEREAEKKASESVEAAS